MPKGHVTTGAFVSISANNYFSNKGKSCLAGRDSPNMSTKVVLLLSHFENLRKLAVINRKRRCRLGHAIAAGDSPEISG